jgi:16S rRNA (guanine527-N7)-methyltransferase
MHDMMQIGSKKWQNLIYEGAKNLDIQIDKRKIEKFAIHALELMKWNQKTNLTAITDPFEVAIKHFLDSIVPVKIIPSNASLLDIGSGGGFPGIPLKIILPSLSVTLIDASRKKVSFLKHIIRILELKNIDALQIRAEEFANKPGVAKKFNVIISRAFSSMTTFALTALPFLKKEGAIIAMRGNVSGDDIQLLRSSLNKRHAILMDEDTEAFKLSVKRYSLPYLKSDRSMVSLKYGNTLAF